MKARVPPAPPKTMSLGSSPTRSVRATCGGVVLTSTMLTLSETWLTTHTSVLLRAATATGSTPTDTERAKERPLGATLKMSRVPFAVLATKSWVPSGESTTGRTGPLSNVKVGLMTMGLALGPASGLGLSNVDELWQAQSVSASSPARRNECPQGAATEEPFRTPHSYLNPHGTGA